MVFKAIVITPNEKTTDFGSLLAIARAEACRREGVVVNPSVRALVFVGGSWVCTLLFTRFWLTENWLTKILLTEKWLARKWIARSQS